MNVLVLLPAAFGDPVVVLAVGSGPRFEVVQELLNLGEIVTLASECHVQLKLAHCGPFCWAASVGVCGPPLAAASASSPPSECAWGRLRGQHCLTRS